MKTLRLLSTTAAVLLVGAGAVSAQGMKNDEAPARAPAAQQNAPAEKVAPALNSGRTQSARNDRASSGAQEIRQDTAENPKDG